MKSRNPEATLLNVYVGQRDPEKQGKWGCLGSVPWGRCPRPPDGKNDLGVILKYTDPRVTALTMTTLGTPGRQPSTKATNHLAKNCLSQLPKSSGI